uniref:Uncharacterized protein n=1 Tax=Leptocylindrus danicus TaxID=163516 RepID=A0A7S2LAW3_9STRA|mmetsp:Transcript_33791/g.48924  ORF Transcript_33791/g.48924 Transcript_33791/m.48924 type:complete len:844 (+) Transcript_33791:173-2704(+)
MKFRNLSVLLALIVTSADAFSVPSSGKYTNVGGVAQFGASRNRVTALRESKNDEKEDVTNTNEKREDASSSSSIADEKLKSDIEMALKKAENALNIVDDSESSVKEDAAKPDLLEKVSQEVVTDAAEVKKVAVPPPKPPKPPVVKDEKTKQIESEALLAAVGGASIGLISGLAVTLALGDVYKDVEIEYVEVIPPAVLTVLLAGLSYTISTGGEDGVNGFVRKNLANIPRGAKDSVTSLVTGITSKIVNAIKAIPTKVNSFVQNKVDQTTAEVQAIPGKIKKTVETKIEETVDEIERIPDKVKVSVERTAKATAEAVDEKINETVEEIKAAPGKVADGTVKFVEQTIDETEKAITKTVDDVVSAPKKFVEEITGTKQEKEKLPTPPKVPPPPEKLQASTTVSPPKLPDTPPPKVDKPPQKIPSFKVPEVPKVEMPKLEVPKVELPKVELPKVELPKVDVPKVPQIQKPPPQQAKVEPPPPKAEKGLDISPPKLPSIQLPEIKPPKLELQNSDNFVFSETSLKDFVGEVVSEDKSELSAREAEAARKAEEKRIEDERRAEAQRVEAERKAEEKRAAAEARKEAQEQARAEQAARRAEAAEAKAAAAAEAQAKREAAAKASQAEQTVKAASPGATISLFGFGQKSESAVEVPSKPAPKARPAPRGVPTILKWRENRDGSISGFISGSPAFDDGDAITTSPIAKGEIVGGNVVQTGSGSRYYLDASSSASGSSSGGGFSLFGRGKENSSPSVKVVPAKKAVPVQKPSRSISLKAAPPKAKVTKRAPPGVPSMVNWRKNRDGSVTGFISGSPAFEEGERITTSPIANGDISAGEVVQTGSGSRYFLV